MDYYFDNIFDFTGGKNSAVSPDNLLDNELMEAQNIDLSLRGGFKRRSGIEEYKNVGSHKIDRLISFEYIDDGGNPVKKLLVLTNGQLIDTDDNSVLTSGLDQHLDYEVYKNKLYMLSSGKYMVYDGTTVTDVTCTEPDSNLAEIAKCKYIEQRGERLFVAGHPENRNLLFYSEIGQPEYFRAINVINTITDDSDYITALKEYYGSLIVFKSKSIFAWRGYDPDVDVTFKRVPAHTGTKAYRTVQYVNNMLVYLGQDGVYALVGTYENVISTIKLSLNITPDLEKILYKNDYHLNPHCAVYHNDKYMLSVPTSDENICDTVFVLFGDIMVQTNRKSWVVYKGWNINDFYVKLDNTLLSASGITGIIGKHNENVYNDLGNAIEVKIVTRPRHQNYPVHNKKYRRGYIAFRQLEFSFSHVTIKAKVDYLTSEETLSPNESLLWGLGDWGVHKWDFIDMVSRKFNIRQKGRRITIEFYDNTLDERLEIYGIGIEYKVKRPNKD